MFSALAGQAGHVDEVLEAGDGVGDRQRAGRVGRAAGMPPKAAQVPTAMVAAALPQTSRAICSADLPPMVQ